MHAGEPEAEQHRSAFVDELREAGLDVHDAKVGDPDPLAATADECNSARLRRADRLHAAAAGVEVAQARPAAQGTCRDRPAGQHVTAQEVKAAAR